MILNKKNPFSVTFRVLLLISTAVALLLLGFETYALKNKITMFSEKQAILIFEKDSLQRLLDFKTREIDSINKNFDSLSAGFKEQMAKNKVAVTTGNVEAISAVNDPKVIDNPPAAAHLVHENQFYTVKKGDCLYKIARELYRDAPKYNIIFEANKPMLKDPNLIYPGQVLIIPTPGA
jgi:LysM repeat protein